MNKKIITLLIILLFSLSVACAEDNTTDDVELEDAANYIMAVSIGVNGIEFSDGFIGFCLDGSDLSTSDGFTSEPTDSDELQNYIKLAIIECYKQSREDDIGEIVASFCDGSYKNSDDELITAVLDSGNQIGDNAVVELDDGSEATFDFELLKSSEDKSDCLAYKVSIDDSTQDSVLGASKDDSQVSQDTSSDDSKDISDDDSKDTTSEDASKDDEKEDASDDKKTEDAQSDDEPIVNETNKTIVNKTNTVIVNEKNTTVITKNNVNNDTPEETILKTAGNPLFILAVVAVVIIVAVVYKQRKG